MLLRTSPTSIEMHRLCDLDELPDSGVKGFRLDSADSGSARFIVVRRGPDIRVYRNRCPHRGTPLDWLPDRFLDAEGKHLVCATHGATFRLEDGHCVAGPCSGDSLESVPCRLEAGAVLIHTG